MRGVSSGRTRTRSHGRPSQTSQAVFLSPEPWRTCEPQSARAKGRVLADPARRHPRTCRAGAAPPPLPPPNPAGSVSPNLGREQRRAPPVLGSAGRGRPRVRTHTQGAAQKPQTAERPPTPVRTAPRPGTAPGGLPPRTPRPRPLGRHRHLELRVAPWDTRGVGPWTQAKQAWGTGRRRRRAGGEDGHGPDGRRPGACVTSGGWRVLRPHLPDLARPKASQGWPCPDSTVTHSRTRPRERSRGRRWLRARGGCPGKTTCQPPSPGSPPWTARRLLP